MPSSHQVNAVPHEVIRLKIRSREKRGVGSTPTIGTLEKSGLARGVVRALGFCRLRIVAHENTVYWSSIRQGRRLVEGQSKGLLIQEKGFALVFRSVGALADAG